MPFLKNCYLFLYIYIYPHPRTIFSLLLEKEEGIEKHISAKEKHQLVASHTHRNQLLNPQPRYVP